MEKITKERPILFSTPMVQAILEGRKMQTRRIVKDDRLNPTQPDGQWVRDLDYIRFWDGHAKFCEKHNHIYEAYVKCPYGQIGDILWVRETWVNTCDLPCSEDDEEPEYSYKADCPSETIPHIVWRPSIFMPKDACRIKLEITDIRVERLGEISEEDAIAEGIEVVNVLTYDTPLYKNYLPVPPSDGFQHSPSSFKSLWTKINGSYDPNVWVWVIEFKRI